MTLPTNVFVGTPTLALWGMKDTFVTPSELDYLSTYVANLQVVTWPDVGHWVEFEKGEELADRIAEFDRSITP